MHLPVGDHDDAGEALLRHICQAAAQRREQPGPIAAAARLRVLAGAHDTDIKIAFAAEAFAQRRQSRSLASRRSPIF